jgi:hypothetical protein
MDVAARYSRFYRTIFVFCSHYQISILHKSLPPILRSHVEKLFHDIQGLLGLFQSTIRMVRFQLTDYRNDQTMNLKKAPVSFR